MVASFVRVVAVTKSWLFVTSQAATCIVVGVKVVPSTAARVLGVAIALIAIYLPCFATLFSSTVASLEQEKQNAKAAAMKNKFFFIIETF